MHNTPPLYHALPYLADSHDYFQRIRHLPWPVLFDSAQSDHPDSRYDILTAAPFQTLTSYGNTNNIEQADNRTTITIEGNPFDVLQQQLAQFPTQPATDLPFCGGAIGLFSYDLGRQLEQLPTLAANNEQTPDLLVGFYDWAIIIDHQTKQCGVASFGLNPKTQQDWPKLIEQLEQMPAEQTEKMTVSGNLNSQLDQDRYHQAFHKIEHYIREGDCYQVNLAKRFDIRAEGDPWYTYQQLRQHNAAPFSVFFDTPEMALLSSSPERLLKLTNGHVETKPIKGTRPRDLNDPKRDAEQAQALITSVKDKAENLMIVDLLRNDLGKVCIPGSISVPKPFSLESFATVHHLVSTITGQLAADQNAVTLLQACFPGGSITGAPKLRAMEIIEELEPDRRGAYCGSFAYIGFDGNMDSNILIRTMVHSHNTLRFWAGGGIVADSDADQEYQEVHDKAAALLSVIESLRQ